MNNLKKFSILILIFVISLSLITSNVRGETTIGNSTFPAEEGKSFRWNTINTTESWYKDVEFVQVKVMNINNGSLESHDCMIVNYTLEYYHKYAWIPQYTNSFYLAYNNSLNFLNWSEEGYKKGNLFIFPTPVNFTLIGDAVEKAGFFNYSIDNNKLILDDGNLTIVELTINTTTGISEVIKKVYNTTTMYRLEFNRNKIIVIIPSGYYFLFFAGFSIVTILYLEKKRIKEMFRK